MGLGGGGDITRMDDMQSSDKQIYMSDGKQKRYERQLSASNNRHLGFAITKHADSEQGITLEKKGIFRDLSDMIKHIPFLKDSNIRVIGSAETGLCGPQSDMDFLIEMEENGVIPALEDVVWELKSHVTGFVLEYYIRTAKIPVVRVLHKRSQIRCDLTFDCPVMRRKDAVKNTQLIKLYGNNCRTFRKLYMFIKLILGEHKIFNKKKGGLSSYAHAIVLIYFLTNKMKCIFIDPETFKITSQKEECMSLPEKLIQYLHFIITDLPSTSIDISKIQNNMGGGSIFQIKDPYINKNHAINLSHKNLSVFRDLARSWITYFRASNSKLLLCSIKQQIPIMNKLSMEQQENKNVALGYIELG